MDNRPQTPFDEQLASALDWWRDAGVDCDFADEAQSWLAEPAAPEEPVASKPARAERAPAPEVRPAIEAAALPTDLAAFAAWWTDSALPLPSAGAPRLAPRGRRGAKLMLLVPMPEVGDRDMLLAGPHGEMLGNIAKALKIAPEDTYYASALPGHMPLPDWDALATDGLGPALLRHVELAAPERLLVFGTRLPALLGHAGSPDTLARVGNTRALATFAPERLLDHKRQRARLWERLQQWIAQ